MMKVLHRKLWRDLARMKGQVIAVALVMACGLAMMIMTRSLVHTLKWTKDEYYQEHGKADVYVRLKRAPMSVVKELERLDGVNALDARVVVDVTLDMPGVDEPSTGHLVSLPKDGQESHTNRLFLRSGRLPMPGARNEVVIGEPFAEANGLGVGDVVVAIINGRKEELKICGIGLSPEFVFEAREGETLPSHKRFSVIWMNYETLAVAYDMDGAFNDAAFDLAVGVRERQVMEEIDRILAVYGGMGAIARSEQASAMRLEDELKVLGLLSFVYPLVFLSVAAFMANAVLARIVRLQREQIAQMKAMGYRSSQVGWHYMQFILVISSIGTAIGWVGGRLLGGKLLGMYELFFRFPRLEFRLDRGALWLAMVFCVGASVIGVWMVVRQAVKLAPAEAMRPEAPMDFKPTMIERIGFKGWLSPLAMMAMRNIERRPWQAVFTSMGLVLATGLMVLPGALSDSIDYLLTHQWNRQQRQDATVVFTEPRARTAVDDIRHLPGVMDVEEVRMTQARFRHGHHTRKVAVTGMNKGAEMNRLMGDAEQVLSLPDEGVLMSEKLGEVLELEVGDMVEVEFLEGKRAKTAVVVRGFVTDYAGVAAYMEIGALRRLMGEGDSINGAYVTVDMTRWKELMVEIKRTPLVAFFMVKKDQLKAFRETTGKSIGMIRVLYLVLAMIVAFGVVYNSARIALSERSRELATMRVVGFRLAEVRAVLVGELAFLLVVSLPLGLWFGKGLAIFIMSSFSTETVRMPIRVEPGTYAVAIFVIVMAALVSFLVVCRMVKQIDMVSALKARE